MAMARCDICGVLIDIDQNPEAYRTELLDAPLICEDCWESSEGLEDEEGDFQ